MSRCVRESLKVIYRSEQGVGDIFPGLSPQITTVIAGKYKNLCRRPFRQAPTGKSALRMLPGFLAMQGGSYADPDPGWAG